MKKDLRIMDEYFDKKMEISINSFFRSKNKSFYNFYTIYYLQSIQTSTFSKLLLKKEI